MEALFHACVVAPWMGALIHFLVLQKKQTPFKTVLALILSHTFSFTYISDHWKRLSLDELSLQLDMTGSTWLLAKTAALCHLLPC